MSYNKPKGYWYNKYTKKGIDYKKTKEYKKMMSKAIKNSPNRTFHQDPEYRKKLSKGAIRAYKEIQANAKALGKPIRKFCSWKIGKTKEEIKAISKKIGEGHKGLKASKETKKKMSESHKKIDHKKLMKDIWKRKDLNQKNKWISNQLKNNPKLISMTEKKLKKFLRKYFPKKWKYVGNGKLMIGGKCPDFLWLGKNKRLIELTSNSNFNRDKKRYNLFKKYNYKTITIQVTELEKDNEKTLIQKIKDFIPIKKKNKLISEDR